MDKKNETPKSEPTVPFFARKVAERELIVRTNLKAGHIEASNKGG